MGPGFAVVLVAKFQIRPKHIGKIQVAAWVILHRKHTLLVGNAGFHGQIIVFSDHIGIEEVHRNVGGGCAVGKLNHASKCLRHKTLLKLATENTEGNEVFLCALCVLCGEKSSCLIQK